LLDNTVRLTEPEKALSALSGCSRAPFYGVRGEAKETVDHTHRFDRPTIHVVDNMLKHSGLHSTTPEGNGALSSIEDAAAQTTGFFMAGKREFSSASRSGRTTGN